MSTPNQCQFWDCDETIRRDYFLCYDHYDEYQAGFIDQCPACGSYKDAEYVVCLNCHRQTAGAWGSSRHGTVSPSNYPDDITGLEELRSLRRKAMSTPNQCQFWDCDETIRGDHFLCFDHYTKYEIGVVDCCPSCGRYKYTPYDVCLTCRQQGQTAEARSPSRSAPAPPVGQKEHRQPPHAPTPCRGTTGNFQRTRKPIDFSCTSCC